MQSFDGTLGDIAVAFAPDGLVDFDANAIVRTINETSPAEWPEATCEILKHLSPLPEPRCDDTWPALFFKHLQYPAFRKNFFTEAVATEPITPESCFQYLQYCRDSAHFSMPSGFEDALALASQIASLFLF